MFGGYGSGTSRSSAVSQATKRERAEVTARYMRGELNLGPQPPMPLICRCLQFDGPHDVQRHASLLDQGYEWEEVNGVRQRKYMRWPWSLRRMAAPG